MKNAVPVLRVYSRARVT